MLGWPMIFLYGCYGFFFIVLAVMALTDDI